MSRYAPISTKFCIYGLWGNVLVTNSQFFEFRFFFGFYGHIGILEGGVGEFFFFWFLWVNGAILRRFHQGVIFEKIYTF